MIKWADRQTRWVILGYVQGAMHPIERWAFGRCMLDRNAIRRWVDKFDKVGR